MIPSSRIHAIISAIQPDYSFISSVAVEVVFSTFYWYNAAIGIVPFAKTIGQCSTARSFIRMADYSKMICTPLSVSLTPVPVHGNAKCSHNMPTITVCQYIPVNLLCKFKYRHIVIKEAHLADQVLVSIALQSRIESTIIFCRPFSVSVAYYMSLIGSSGGSSTV